MTSEPQSEAWPRDRFHPVYEGFSEWLDNEAPETPPTPPAAKRHNRPRYRKITRR